MKPAILLLAIAACQEPRVTVQECQDKCDRESHAIAEDCQKAIDAERADADAELRLATVPFMYAILDGGLP